MACFEAQVKYHIGPFLDFISIQFIGFMALPRAFGVPQSLALLSVSVFRPVSCSREFS